MSDEPRFVFEYDLTQRDLRDLERALRAKSRDLFRLVIVLSVLVWACWSSWQGEHAEATAKVVLAGLIFRLHRFTSPAFSISLWLLKMRLRVEMDDKEVRVHSYVRKSETPSQTLVNSWVDLAREGEAREHARWFLFTTAGANQFGIPQRAFESEEQLHEFREFIRSKLRCRFADAFPMRDANDVRSPG
jgi:hypothetical protein